MQYTYTVFKIKDEARSVSRQDIFTREEELKEEHVTHPFYVEVFNNSNKIVDKYLRNINDLKQWLDIIEGQRVSAERAAAWKFAVKEMPVDCVKVTGESAITTTIPVVSSTTIAKNAVKPTHYENFIDEYQWLDAMSRIPRYKDPKVFAGAVELQIRKYLDRNGRKDDEIQELRKGLFYYMYLLKYLQNNGKPILAKDIHSIMEHFK
jgi:hypothetical protein